MARKFDGSAYRRKPGRPPLCPAIEKLILRFARENRNWGYDRISGALKNLGHQVSDATIANVLKRHGLPPAGDRNKETSWRELIDTHMNVLAATDFFTTEVWSRFGLVTYYVLFFIHLGTRTVHIGGITSNPDQLWIAQIIRNITDVDEGMLMQNACRYVIHDRDRDIPVISISPVYEDEIIVWISAQFRWIILLTVTISRRESCLSDVLVAKNIIPESDEFFDLTRTGRVQPRTAH